jgi:hypothetical protein
MTKFASTLIVCNVGILGILWGPDLAILPAGAADVVVKGSYHTTQEDAVFNNYNAESTDVTVNYTVATKIENGKKVFDYSDTNSFLTFKNEEFVTVKIPITHAEGDPNTGAVTSFKFSGKEWDGDHLSTGAQDVKNDGVSGEVDVKNATATVESKYIDSDGKKASYAFATANKKPEGAKKDPKTDKPVRSDSSIPPERSIDYNAATKMLSISGDTIVKTPDSTDPILGANVNFSDYQFTGFTSDGKLAIFWATSGEGPLSITKGANTFEKGDLPALFYDVADNLFFGSPLAYTLAGMPTSSPFYDPTLATISSQYLNSIEDVLDPSSPYFAPNAFLYETISPNTNLETATNGFTISGGSGAVDSQLVAGEVPEPSTWVMMLVGFAGLGFAGYRRATRGSVLVV